MPGRPLSSDAKSILNVYQFLGIEKHRGKLWYGVDNPCRRFKAMAGYDLTTAQNILKNHTQKTIVRKE